VSQEKTKTIFVIKYLKQMSDEKPNHDLSLDDIFSRLRKEDKAKGKVIGVPFKFLDSYTIDDKNIFFGRDNETDDIFRKLYSGKLLLVYGKSGTGKSSIINCGLISKIPQEDIYTINIRCGRKAYDNFVSGIKKYSDSNLDNPLEILEDIFYEQSKPIALIFDQFEEIFILSDEAERLKLARELSEILKSRLKINIILVIREEYFANLTEFEEYLPGLYGNRTRIERMSKSAAKEAIIKPCKVCNVGIEDGLADKIIEHLVWQSEGLELTWLQILMDKLYRTAVERDPVSPFIKYEDLVKLGRMGNVLSDFLDEQLRLMPNGDMGEAVLKTMISTDGTKKQVNFADISDTLQTTGHVLDQRLIEEILRYFVNVRIITDKDEQGYYELRHDAIAGRIYERMTAIEKELIEVKTFLDNSYKIYGQRKVLLTDNDLKYIALYENKLILNNELKEFIKISKKGVQKARQRRTSIAAAVAVALILIMSGFSIWALNERTKAVEQSKIAEEQKNEAIKANTEAENARMEALDGKNKAEQSEAIAVDQKRIAEQQRQEAIRANIEAENARKQALQEKDNAVIAKQEAENAKNEVIKASNQAQFYLYLFNGKELANKSLIIQENNTTRALLSLSSFDLASYGYENFGQEVSSVKYDNEILQSLQKAYLLFEPDSLVTGEIWAVPSINERTIYSNKGGQLIVSRLETQKSENLPELVTITTIDLPAKSLVRSITIDATGQKIACGTLDGNVTLIGLQNDNIADKKIIYNHNNSRILYMSFVPGKNWLISSSLDKTIRIWDLQQQQTIKELQLDEAVQKFALTGSGHLVFGNSSGQVLQWDLNNLNLNPLVIYTDESRRPFKTIAYNPIHKWLALTSLGKIMIFPFNPESEENLKFGMFITKHKGAISHIDFSPDNRWLVSASQDAIILWDLRDIGSTEIDKFVPIVVENNRQIFSLAFDEESKYLLYGDNLLLHIYPIDIQDVYSKLKMKMGDKKLTDQEWKYYVKGDLVRPETK
jgi:WD40 repeat protein/energy-coupling factor transporter ATP-binding protein EcfA2